MIYLQSYVLAGLISLLVCIAWQRKDGNPMTSWSTDDVGIALMFFCVWWLVTIVVILLGCKPLAHFLIKDRNFRKVSK